MWERFCRTVLYCARCSGMSDNGFSSPAFPNPFTLVTSLAIFFFFFSLLPFWRGFCKCASCILISKVLYGVSGYNDCIGRVRNCWLIQSSLESNSVHCHRENKLHTSRLAVYCLLLKCNLTVHAQRLLWTTRKLVLPSWASNLPPLNVTWSVLFWSPLPSGNIFFFFEGLHCFVLNRANMLSCVRFWQKQAALWDHAQRNQHSHHKDQVEFI